MNIGRLDRKVTLQSPTETIGASGGVAVAYADEATVAAQKVETTGRESRGAGALRAETDAAFRVRYRSTLTTKYRMVYESKNYDILSIAEEGRRESQLIQARFTEGAAR